LWYHKRIEKESREKWRPIAGDVIAPGLARKQWAGAAVAIGEV